MLTWKSHSVVSRNSLPLVFFRPSSIATISLGRSYKHQINLHTYNSVRQDNLKQNNNKNFLWETWILPMALFGLVAPLREIIRRRSKNIFPPRRQRQSDVVHKDLGFHLDSVSLRRSTVRLPSVNYLYELLT